MIEHSSLPSADPQALARECRLFTQYLLGVVPAPDVVAAYQRAHETGSVRLSGGVAPSLERALLTLAERGSVWTRAADAYAALFARGSLLRRKLVLLLAILESRADSSSQIDTADPGSRVAWVGAMAVRAGGSALLVVLALVALVPLRIRYRRAAAGGF